MNVLIVTAHFPPEPLVTSQTSLDVAERLLREGHQVTVVTSFPSRPAGRPYPGYRRRAWKKSRDAGSLCCDSLLFLFFRVLNHRESLF